MIPHIYAFLTCIFITLSAFAEEESSENFQEIKFFSKMQKLRLDEKFKDFISQNIPARENAENTVSVKYLLVEPSEKKFVGVTFEFNKESGEVLSVQPLLKTEKDGVEEIMLWAFDRFHNREISFDSLWDIVTSCSGRAIDHKQIIQLLANGLSTYDDRNSIPIYENGPVIKAVSEMKKDAFVQNNRLMLMDLMKSIIE